MGGQIFTRGDRFFRKKMSRGTFFFRKKLSGRTDFSGIFWPGGQIFPADNFFRDNGTMLSFEEYAPEFRASHWHGPHYAFGRGDGEVT